MATSYNDLFGKKSSDSEGGKRYLKWESVGDVVVMQQIGEAVSDHPQYVFGTSKKKFLVKMNAEDKYKPMGEGDFDPDEVENSFPATEIMIPVRVLKVTKADGTVDETEFDAEWTFKGDQQDKFKDALLELGEGIGEGTAYAVKYLADGKPRKYAVKIKNG